MFTASDVNLDRVGEELAALSEIGKTAEGGVTRFTFRGEHLAATEMVAQWMVEAGLAVHFDRWGNLFGRMQEANGVACVLTGSHLDSVENGGNFDGPLGVLSSLEAVRIILENKSVKLRRPIEVVSFIEEEGGRFIVLLGSRLAAGHFSDEAIAEIRDSEGNRFLDVRDSIDLKFPVDEHDDLRHRVDKYLELHIEQGKRLEVAGVPIGRVTSIAGPKFFRVQLTGHADHAGTTDYEDRRDALLAASEVVASVRKVALERFVETGRMTVGKISVEPNVVNVVAGEAILDIDTRAGDLDTRREIDATLHSVVKQACEPHGVVYEIEALVEVSPTPTPDSILDSVKKGCDQADVACKDLISWAAHDAMIMSTVSEAGMIFVPCRDGRSHSPAEYVKPDDIAIGVAVLANALVDLAS